MTFCATAAMTVGSTDATYKLLALLDSGNKKIICDQYTVRVRLRVSFQTISAADRLFRSAAVLRFPQHRAHHGLPHLRHSRRLGGHAPMYVQLLISVFSPSVFVLTLICVLHRRNLQLRCANAWSRRRRRALQSSSCT
jgi:hypothetical protein